MAGTQAEVEALDWKDAEKFFWLDGAIKTLAERAMDYNVVAIRLVKADDIEGLEHAIKLKGAETKTLYYNGSLPMLIASVRYLCFYKLGPEGVG